MTIRDLTVKERILLHLFDFNRFAEEYEAPVEVTQSGIAKATGIRIQHVTQYVKPLLEEDRLEERISHISQRPRRRKVYFLTAQGKHNAATLRNSLFKEKVPLRARSGSIQEFPLSRVYQADRRGTRLSELLDELRSTGFISEVVSASAPGLVDFTHEAPLVDEFYGRERELREVFESLEKTPMLVIIGMAGIGKTALGSKAAEKFRENRSLFWRRIRPWDRAADLASRLAGFLKALGSPRLDSFLRSGREDLSKIEDMLRVDLVGQKALLVFDDAHKAQNDAQGFLALVFDVLKQQKDCVVLLLSRITPTFYSRRDVEVDASVAELFLSSLDPESATRMLSDAGVPDALHENLLRVSGGNPLFLKVLSKAGTADRVIAARKTLETYISEEIEPSLSAEELSCLQIASFYEVPVPVRGLLLERKGGTGTVLGLQARGLLDQLEVEQFVLHDSLRDYFQGGLPVERRKELSEKVVPWLLEQAKDAEHNREFGDAISLVENALEFETDSKRRFTSLVKVGRLREGAREISESLEAYRAALAATDDVEEKATLHQDIATVFTESGRFQEAERELETAQQLLPPGPSVATAWLLLDRASSLRVDSGDYRGAWEDIDQVAKWQAILRREPELEAYLDLLKGFLHAADPARRDLSKADKELRAAEKASLTGNRHRLIWIYEILANVGRLEGRAEDALRYCDKGMAVSDEGGWVDGRLRALVRKGTCLEEFFGRYEEASALYEEAHNLGAKMLNPPAYVHLAFAKLYERQGRFEEAREALSYYFDQAQLEDWDPDLRILTWMVHLCLQSGDEEDAKDFFREAKSRTPRSPKTGDVHAISWAEAALYEHRGKAAEAIASFQIAMKHMEAMRCWDELEWAPMWCWKSSAEFLLAYGRFLSGIGKEEEATEVLQQTIVRTEEHGLEPLKQAALAEVEALSARESQRLNNARQN